MTRSLAEAKKEQKVKFEDPKHYKEWTMYHFSFEPEDLIPFNRYKKLFEKW